VVSTRYHVISNKVSETDSCLTYRPTTCDACCCCLALPWARRRFYFKKWNDSTFSTILFYFT